MFLLYCKQVYLQLALCFGLLPSALLFSTALDDYVMRFDPHYQWEIQRIEESDKAHILVATLTSQQWQSSATVDHPLWKHRLTIIVPKLPLGSSQGKTAILSIAGGQLDSLTTADLVDDLPLLELAVKTQTIVCELTLVPNQPLKFHDEWDERYKQNGRREDALVAYTWDKYLKTEDSGWPLRLPMTKSVVRGMDAIQEILSQKLALSIDGFIVMGKSKRGWTAWTTAAVDKRVKGIIPIVIDLLNLKTSFIRHHRAYGNWSFAVHDYADIDIPGRWDQKAFENLMAMIEPFEYRERFTMPKFVINATGDEFFLPDSSRLYFKELSEPKHLWNVPNTGHRIKAELYIDNLIAYLNVLLSGTPFPSYDWEITEGNRLKISCPTPPAGATLWQAHNPHGRDFRVVTIGTTWSSRPLDPISPGKYEVALAQPDSGWSAYFVELTFVTPQGAPLKVSTDLFVLPDTFPF